MPKKKSNVCAVCGTSLNYCSTCGRKVGKEDRKTLPKKLNFCPNCGEKLKKDDVTQTACVDVRDGEIEFDVYCGKCEWSGDISPDRK